MNILATIAIPDSGTTIALLALAVASLLVLRRKIAAVR